VSPKNGASGSLLIEINQLRFKGIAGTLLFQINPTFYCFEIRAYNTTSIEFVYSKNKNVRFGITGPCNPFGSQQIYFPLLIYILRGKMDIKK
jgi:hypothetical protein